MKLRWPFVLAILAGLGALAVALASTDLRAAQEELDAARVEWNRAQLEAQRTVDLRGRDEVISPQETSDQNVLSLVLGILAEEGFPNESFKSLERDSDTPLRGPLGSKTRFRKQSVKLDLTGLEPRQIGLFLDKLRQTQKVWIPSRIQLAHMRQQVEPQSRYDVSILLSSIYLSDRIEGS